MRLGSVARIVLPATALLHTETAPLNVRKRAVLWQRLGRVLGQNHVTVFKFAILVLFRVLNLDICVRNSGMEGKEGDGDIVSLEMTAERK